MADIREIRDVYNLIKYEMVGAWAYLNAYVGLFEHTDERRQKLMESTAPGFFNIVNASFAECLLIKIARMLDPAKTGKHKNMNFSTLFNIGDIGDPALKNSFFAIQDEWKNGKYKPIYDYRNKLSAHNDYKAIQRNPSGVLTRLTHQEFSLIKALFIDLWKVLAKVHMVINNASLLEPQHEKLADLPATIFVSLGESLFLEDMLNKQMDDEAPEIFHALSKFEYADVGRDTPIRLISP